MTRVESRALAKGLQLIELLNGASGAVSLAELSRTIDLGKASAFRLLQTLVATGHVTDDGAGNYRIARLPEAAAAQSVERLIVDTALSEMQALNAETAETVTIAMLRDDHVRVVESLDSPHQIRHSNPVGRIVAPYASSLGKAITAWQPAARQQHMIAVYGIYQFTDFTLTDPVAIRKEMARVRERGYAHEREESVRGGCCYAAPIFCDGSTVKAAVSIAMPLIRHTAESDKRFPALLRAATRRISLKLRGKVPTAA